MSCFTFPISSILGAASAFAGPKEIKFGYTVGVDHNGQGYSYQKIKNFDIAKTSK